MFITERVCASTPVRSHTSETVLWQARLTLMYASCASDAAGTPGTTGPPGLT